MTNLTANTKNYGQITLNTKPHSDPLKRGRFIVTDYSIHMCAVELALKGVTFAFASTVKGS